jgi:hypothetical protein
MPAVFPRIVAHSILAALVAISGLALAQSPRVQAPQPTGSSAVRPVRARPGHSTASSPSSTTK